MLGTRIEEHQSGCRLQQTDKSAIIEHAWNTGHSIHWGSVDILSLGERGSPHTYKHLEAAEEVYVVKNLSRSLLACPAIEALGLVQRINTVQTKTDIETRFPKLFGSLGKLEEKYKIVLRDDTHPYAQFIPRRIAIPLLPKVKAELERMEQMRVVRRVRRLTDWCSSMVVVPKGDRSVRICVDLSPLNESVRREHHPLPAVEQALAQFAQAMALYPWDTAVGA